MISEPYRPDPDELLASLLREEAKSKQGKLKIFFGMCPGVGKTYTMLKSAQIEKSKGIDVIIGIVETHGFNETNELVKDFEIVDNKSNFENSAGIFELDLDAIISRKPQIVLIDELAYCNGLGSRNLKRYQDIQEILDNGINVYTTLNVQNLENRSDTVSRVTGVVTKDILPYEVFENANEVEVVDLSPDELLERLSKGKVFTGDWTQETKDTFFHKGNIIGLREMALRIVANRVDQQLHDYMQHERIRGPWKSGLNLLLAIDYSLQSIHLIRWAKKLSFTMGANIQAIYIETSHSLTKKKKDQLDKNINLLKLLGINFQVIVNNDVVNAIVDFAQKKNVTHILVGKPRIRNVLSMFHFGNIVNRLIQKSGNIDIYILGKDNHARDQFKERGSLPSFTSNINQYFVISLYVVLTSMICYLFKNYIEYKSVSFILLFLISFLAIFFGTGPLLLAVILSALIWDFVFIPPQFTLYIERPLDILMLIMFFIIALLNGVLTSRIRRQEKKIRIRERRTDTLYQLTKDLSMGASLEEVLKITLGNIQKYFHLESVILLKNELNQLDREIPYETKFSLTENEFSVATWVFNNSSKAGKYTEILPSTDFTFYPLKGYNENMGVIIIKPVVRFVQDEARFFEVFLSQISSKFEHEYLRIEVKKTYFLNESDKLYNTLFNSISHELRIPVSTIMGVSDLLLNRNLTEETNLKLFDEINIASIRLNQLIENLLNMSRLESGHITPHFDWCDVHDLANKVTDNLRHELEHFKFNVQIPIDMPLVLIDFGLMERVLCNLVLNATQNAPFDSNIRMNFFYDSNFLNIQIMDRGKGFLENDMPSLFNKFYRGKDAKAGGTGLGLSIVKGFVQAHQGIVKAENRKDGGAIFTIQIPVKIFNQ